MGEPLAYDPDDLERAIQAAINALGLFPSPAETGERRTQRA